MTTDSDSLAVLLSRGLLEIAGETFRGKEDLGETTKQVNKINEASNRRVRDALELAARQCCAYCREGMTPIKSNKAKGRYGHYFAEQGTEEVCGPDADAIRALKKEYR